MRSTNIAIFASGSGSNAQRIAEYFAGNRHIRIVSIYSNNPAAYVIERARDLGIPSRVFSRKDFYESDTVLEQLRQDQVDLVVLAGFLWLVPVSLIRAFPGRMINIHPALLPGYGGKGMYGAHVHQAVVANREKESGITIHLVNEEYDKGTILFQGKVPLAADETAESLAARIHELEYAHFPVEIEKYIQKENASGE